MHKSLFWFCFFFPFFSPIPFSMAGITGTWRSDARSAWSWQASRCPSLSIYHCLSFFPSPFICKSKSVDFYLSFFVSDTLATLCRTMRTRRWSWLSSTIGTWRRWVPSRPFSPSKLIFLSLPKVDLMVGALAEKKLPVEGFSTTILAAFLPFVYVLRSTGLCSCHLTCIHFHLPRYNRLKFDQFYGPRFTAEYLTDFGLTRLRGSRVTPGSPGKQQASKNERKKGKERRRKNT